MVPEVTAESPSVREAILEAERKALSRSPDVTADVFSEALKSGITLAQERRRETDPTGPQ